MIQPRAFSAGYVLADGVQLLEYNGEPGVPIISEPEYAALAQCAEYPMKAVHQGQPLYVAASNMHFETVPDRTIPEGVVGVPGGALDSAEGIEDGDEVIALVAKYPAADMLSAMRSPLMKAHV